MYWQNILNPEPAYKATPAYKAPAGRKFRYQTLILILCISLLTANVVVGTMAYVEYRTSAVVNTFSAAGAPEPVIDEDFTTGDIIKSNVKVRLEDGDGAYYFRAAIIVTMLNDDGTTAAIVPQAGTDYEIVMGSDWTQQGDYWYYTSAVPAGQTTTNLIESCTTLNSDYRLVVDVLAQTIQANPGDAASGEWGYTP